MRKFTVLAVALLALLAMALNAGQVLVVRDQSKADAILVLEGDQFGVRWWRHRQWAKVTLGEWTRLIWWECVDRWR